MIQEGKKKKAATLASQALGGRGSCYPHLVHAVTLCPAHHHSCRNPQENVKFRVGSFQGTLPGGRKRGTEKKGRENEESFLRKM